MCFEAMKSLEEAVGSRYCVFLRMYRRKMNLPYMVIAYALNNPVFSLQLGILEALLGLKGGIVPGR